MLNIYFKIIIKTLTGRCLVGKGTGKTSLVQRYVNEEFDNNVTTTVGAGFANKRMYVHTQLWLRAALIAHNFVLHGLLHRVMDDVKIKLQIWDTAGQERFRYSSCGFH
jgi:GTPase SAR1 family protein